MRQTLRQVQSPTCAITLKPEQKEENDAASDSSILLGIVQSVAIKADERSANKKRKRSMDEAEEKELQDGEEEQ